MRRTAAVALRSQRGFALVGRSVDPHFVLGLRSLSTSADDLLDLFKQAASKITPSPPSAGQREASPPGAAGRGRVQSSSGHWAKDLATKLQSSESAPSHPAAQPMRAERPAPRPFQDSPAAQRRKALFSPVGTAENATPPPRRGGRQRRPRPDITPTLDDPRFLDHDEFDDEDYMLRVSTREAKDDANDLQSFSSAIEEGGDDEWEAMAAEMSAWGLKLHNTLRPHLEIMNKHTKTKRMRRQKYQAFLERVVARRQAKKTAHGKSRAAWQWPEKRDLLYNTDLFVPLNLELKGIEEEGEDLHGLLTAQMEEAARAIGHNGSWPLEEKRKLMLGLKKFYEKAVRSGPAPYDIFADHRHAMDDDFVGSSGPTTSEE